jgi:hypothetical protein
METITRTITQEQGSMKFIPASKQALPKRRIYISGKITGLHEDVYTKYFTLAEALLLNNGWEVINPVGLDHIHDGTWESYLLEDIKHLFTCDAIYMLCNWPTSRGSRIERAIAYELGKQIIYEDALNGTTL